MSRSSRTAALLCYALGLPGALVVLLARRHDPFASYHARQALRLGLAALLPPPIWLVLAWGLAWIPLVGPMLGVMLFALVPACYCGLVLLALVGMAHSLRGQARPLPLLGSTAPGWSIPASPLPTIQPERHERTTTSDA